MEPLNIGCKACKCDTKAKHSVCVCFSAGKTTKGPDEHEDPLFQLGVCADGMSSLGRPRALTETVVKPSANGGVDSGGLYMPTNRKMPP